MNSMAESTLMVYQSHLKVSRLMTLLFIKRPSDDGVVIKLKFIEKDGQELQRVLISRSNPADFDFQANFYNNRLISQDGKIID